MSKEQREFIRKYRLNKLFVLGIQVMIVIVFFKQYSNSYNRRYKY